MRIKKEYVAAVLAVLCLAVALFLTVPTRSQIGAYDPWADVNDDGTIDMADISIEIDKFMSSGTPLAKQGLLYDSGWINITDKCGKDIDVLHLLNSQDVTAVITGKIEEEGRVHQRSLGLDHVPGWSRQIGETDTMEAIECAIQTRDEGYAFVGWKDTDVWLVKIDAQGNVQWERTYDSGDADRGHSVVQTIDGGYVIAAAAHSAGSNNDFWLIKTQSDGQAVLFRKFGDPLDDYPYCIIQTSDEGFAVAGKAGMPDSNDFCLLKTDSNLGKEWWATYGASGGGDECLFSVVQADDGGYMTVGVHTSPTTLSDIWLCKWRSDGWYDWERKYGDWYDDWARSLIKTKDGGYAIAGTLTHVTELGPKYDFWLVKTNADGYKEWDRLYDISNSSNAAQEIIQTDDGGYAIAGLQPPVGALLVKTDNSGNVQWIKIGEIGLFVNVGSAVQSYEGGFIMVGSALDPAINDLDGWLIKLDMESGLAWTDSFDDRIVLHRGATDPYWNFVRVQIWGA